MTDDEALTEARRRWGPNAWAVPPIREGPTQYHVCQTPGICGRKYPLATWGEGPTWEAAFADAERRAAGAT